MRIPKPAGWHLHCQCDHIPYGTYPAFETPEGAITMTIGDEIEYTFGSAPIVVEVPDYIVTMTIRLWNDQSKTRVMKAGQGEKLEYQWEFSFPTCDCGPEPIHHKPGKCLAEFDPEKGFLAFHVLKDSDNKPERVGAGASAE